MFKVFVRAIIEQTFKFFSNNCRTPLQNMSHIMLYKCPWIILEYFITVSEQFQKCSSGLLYNISKKMEFSGTIVEHLSYHAFSLAPAIAQVVQFYDMSPLYIWNTVDMALKPKKKSNPKVSFHVHAGDI